MRGFPGFFLLFFWRLGFWLSLFLLLILLIINLHLLLLRLHVLNPFPLPFIGLIKFNNFEPINDGRLKQLGLAKPHKFGAFKLKRLPRFLPLSFLLFEDDMREQLDFLSCGLWDGLFLFDLLLVEVEIQQGSEVNE